MDNYLKALSADGNILCHVLNSTAIVERARTIHNTLPVCTAALGRVLTATSMIGGSLKESSHSVTIQVKGDGPAGAILAVSDAFGNVRGYLQNPSVDLPLNEQNKLDVAGAVGRKGYINVIKDFGLKEPYIGMTPIVSGEIAEDIANYFVVSEQIPTACAFGVLVDVDYSVKAAGGYLLQLLPGAPENAIEKLEENISVAGPVSAMIDRGLTLSEIAGLLFMNIPYEVIDVSERHYLCNCSRERIERALLSLGKMELLRLAAEEEHVEVSCHFCEKKFVFEKDEIVRMSDRLKK